MSGGPGAERGDSPPSDPDVAKDAYERTLAEMDELEAELEADGWDVIAIPSGGVATPHPESGTDDRFGFIHVIPGNFADEFRQLFDPESFGRYDVLRSTIEGEVYFLTALYAEGLDRAILLAGAYKVQSATGLYRAAREAGHVFTHVEELDGTHLGSFKHPNWEKFFPETVARAVNAIED